MNRFEEERVLGTGGFGRAVLVRLRARPSERCALKVMECGRDLQSANRALVEATTLSALDHPYIVKITEVFLHEEAGADGLSVCILMEYAAGGDLCQHLQMVRDEGSGARARTHLLEWIGQLASALTYIHSKDIVHRDVKPSNVFLQLPSDSTDIRRSSVRLGDFGVAKLAQKGRPVTMTQVGTPAFLAPEQLFAGDYGAPVDVWGFGIVCHEISAACKGNSFLFEQTWILGARVSKAPVAADDLFDAWPKSVRQLVSTCLREDPTQRPTAREVHYALSPSASGKGASPAAKEVPVQVRVETWLVRNEPLVAAHKTLKVAEGDTPTSFLAGALEWFPQAETNATGEDLGGITQSALAFVSSWMLDETGHAASKAAPAVLAGRNEPPRTVLAQRSVKRSDAGVAASTLAAPGSPPTVLAHESVKRPDSGERLPPKELAQAEAAPAKPGAVIFKHQPKGEEPKRKAPARPSTAPCRTAGPGASKDPKGKIPAAHSDAKVDSPALPAISVQRVIQGKRPCNPGV